MSVVIASRLSSAAGTGEVLVQDLVQALVASRDGVTLEVACDYELKGVPDPGAGVEVALAGAGAGGERPGRRIRPDPAEAPGPMRLSGEGRRSPGDIRMPPMLAAYAEEPLIGRDREIASCARRPLPGTGRRAVLILGEPGIGKTRHAAAAAAEAHADGAVVVLARCPPEAVDRVRALGARDRRAGARRRRRLARDAGRGRRRRARRARARAERACDARRSSCRRARSWPPRAPATGCCAASVRRWRAPPVTRPCTWCSTMPTGATPPPRRRSGTCWRAPPRSWCWW